MKGCESWIGELFKTRCGSIGCASAIAFVMGLLIRRFGSAFTPGFVPRRPSKMRSRLCTDDFVLSSCLASSASDAVARLFMMKRSSSTDQNVLVTQPSCSGQPRSKRKPQEARTAWGFLPSTLVRGVRGLDLNQQLRVMSPTTYHWSTSRRETTTAPLHVQAFDLNATLLRSFRSPRVATM